MEPAWRVVISRSAERDLDRAPADVRQRIRDALDGLATTPRVGDIVKLQGTSNGYRLRVGEWRVLFAADGDRRMVKVTTIRPCGSAYRC